MNHAVYGEFESCEVWDITFAFQNRDSNCQLLSFSLSEDSCFVEDSLPSFTSREIQDCQTFAIRVQKFLSAKQFQRIYKKRILNPQLQTISVIYYWNELSKNYRPTIYAYVGETRAYPGKLIYMLLNWSAKSKTSRTCIALVQRTMAVPSDRSLSDFSKTTALSPSLLQK